MPCTLKREDVSEIVVDILRNLHNDPSITEFSRFGIELMVDPFARATLYPPPITASIKQEGCILKTFGPTDCQKAQDVEDIVTAVWNDVKSGQALVAMAAQPAPKVSAASKKRKAKKGGAKKPKKTE